MEKKKKIVVIGGNACGPKAAARARRLDQQAQITLVEQVILDLFYPEFRIYIRNKDGRGDLVTCATWNDIWLNPEFRSWNIEAELAAIRCRLLAIQGIQDEYGTLEQIHGIARRLPQAEVVELPGCGHSPGWRVRRTSPVTVNRSTGRRFRQAPATWPSRYAGQPRRPGKIP